MNNDEKEHEEEGRNSLVIFIMEAIQFWGGHKALYGNRKKIVFNAEAFDKAFLHHLFIKIQSIKMNMWKGKVDEEREDGTGGIGWK